MTPQEELIKEMLAALKAVSNYADSVNASSDLFGNPIIEHVKAVIGKAEGYNVTP